MTLHLSGSKDWQHQNRNQQKWSKPDTVQPFPKESKKSHYVYASKISFQSSQEQIKRHFLPLAFLDSNKVTFWCQVGDCTISALYVQHSTWKNGEEKSQSIPYTRHFFLSKDWSLCFFISVISDRQYFLPPPVFVFPPSINNVIYSFLCVFACYEPTREVNSLSHTFESRSSSLHNSCSHFCPCCMSTQKQRGSHRKKGVITSILFPIFTLFANHPLANTVLRETTEVSIGAAALPTITLLI